MKSVTLNVPDISCEHCERAITGALSGAVAGLITDQNTSPAVAAAIEETGGVVISARPAATGA